MKLLRLALILLAVAPFARAADDDEKKPEQPPEEIPDFSNLDEYIYQPKSTLNFGFRYISGVKAKFWGNGQINTPEALPDATATNIDRTYHDGRIQPDSRTNTVDNGDGTTSTVPITPDGKTNTWNYDTGSQLAPNGSTTGAPDGFLRYHLYSAQILDDTVHDKTGKGNMGLEVSMARDIGNLSKRLSLKFFAGMSANDIQAASMAGVKANITTITDTYDLFGQTPTSPTNPTGATTQTTTDVNGNAVTQTVDTSTLLGNAPLGRSTSSAIDSTTVTDHWKLHGSYITFRAGPMLVYDFSDRLHFNLGVGVALLYAGSTYEVDEVLNAPTGGEIIDKLTDTTSRLLPGYYADATVQYDITDRTGLYFGAFFQNAGSYTQTASASGNPAFGDASGTGNGDYKTNVDFADQQGIRTGVTFKF